LLALLKNRQRLIVLTKSDLALENETDKWIEHFVSEGQKAVAVNLLNNKDIMRLVKTIVATDGDKRRKEATRGMKPQPLRIMVVGVPNAGKSTLINKLAGKRVALVENRPGKTKAQQWIKVDNKFLLLDTPGILPMKFEKPELAINLALLGMVKEDILPKEELASKIVSYLKDNHPQQLITFYSLKDSSLKDERTIIEQIALSSGALIGGNLDLNRASMILLNDFRDGRITRLSLEKI